MSDNLVISEAPEEISSVLSLICRIKVGEETVWGRVVGSITAYRDNGQCGHVPAFLAKDIEGATICRIIAGPDTVVVYFSTIEAK